MLYILNLTWYGHVDELANHERGKERKGIYIAPFILRSLKALRHGSHSFTCKLHHACLSFVSVHRMAPPLIEVADIQLQLTILIYRPRRDERLSWPGWLIYSWRLSHINGHPSATGRAQGRESLPAKDRRSTTKFYPYWGPYSRGGSYLWVRSLSTGRTYGNVQRSRAVIIGEARAHRCDLRLPTVRQLIVKLLWQTVPIIVIIINFFLM